jgi:two-component system, cell cycle sensor histidine kinase and response regulator CckA
MTGSTPTARALAGLAAALGAAFLLAWAAVPLPRLLRVGAIDLLWLALALVAAAALVRARRLPDRRHLRRPLGLLALGALVWAAGQAIWTFQELAQGIDAPVFALADIGFLLSMPLLALGLLAWPRERPARDVGRVFDVLLVAGFATVFGLEFVVEPLRAHGSDAFGSFYVVAYPPVAILVSAAALAVLTLDGWVDRAALELASLGLLSLSAAAVGYLHLGEDYVTGGPIDPLWTIAFLLLAAAALVPPGARRAVVGDRVRVFIPAGLLIVLIVAAAFLQLPQEQSLTSVELVALAGLVVLLAARQGQAQIAVRRLARRHALVLESAGEGILAVDAVGRIEFANDVAARMIRREPHELHGRFLVDVVAALGDGSMRAALEGRPRRGELTLPSADGTPFPVAYTATPRVEHGVPVGATVVFADVTEQRQLEQQLRHAQKLEAVGRLAGGVAHDFNNLLTAIDGYSELALLRLGMDDPARDDIEEVQRAARRAADLTRQLLAFSRRQVLTATVVDLNEVVAGAERMLRRLIAADVELETRLAEDPTLVAADAGQLEQVITNLVLNARDAMPSGGRVLVETARDRDASGAACVRLTVADTGAGMSEETKARIFEPFFTTKDVGKGTGLGLAMVHGIVAQSEGEVTVTSAPGEGARFDILLPAAAEPTAPAAAAEVEPVAGQGTLLLVEDDDAVREFSRRVLEGAGFRVVAAASGAEALELDAGLERLNLLVTDVVMPGLTGRELAETMRLRRTGLPVVLMSGYSRDAAALEELLAGGATFLEKPFTSADLLAVVGRVLEPVAV